MAGAIGRPKLDPAMIDAATMPLVPRMMQALGQGDDGALRVVIALFEEAGFALRAADVSEASESEPVHLRLNPETIACGTAPALSVTAGTATPIATGGPIPRGADAVVMIEYTAPLGAGISVSRALAPGAHVSFAGSDIARGQTVLRRGIVIGAREVAMLAAVGLDHAAVWRKPRVAVLSTGDELVQPGAPLRPAAVYDSNGPVIAAALRENGCEAVHLGAVRDQPEALEAAIRAAFDGHDALILSGGTSKGAGDLTTKTIAGLGSPGIVARVTKIGSMYKTEILIDLTGLRSTAGGDIIGDDGTALACHIGQITAAVNGTIFAGRISCLETPTGGDPDIDLFAATAGTAVEDTAISGVTGQASLVNAGDHAVGGFDMLTAFPAANSYLYLVAGDTTDADYTAGILLIELWGK
jgi:molybdenum cofactor synthesis domain-containing protein